ncbi:BLUF domain-containing protein [Sphingomonas parva]|uniref:BLUF domain-containing protein n=1 Tax=Sphingomonas parva TaxID=2555898 RepID=UPI0014309E5A|nr:BLUF domain-containing protein [Sphingomonas parva]
MLRKRHEGKTRTASGWRRPEEGTTLKTLLFVSASRIERTEEAEQLRAIVAAGRRRNASLGVYSALVAARGHFGEVVDGPEDHVDAVMATIAGDPRHERVKVVLEQTVAGAPPRPGMDLVYSGGSLYVARYITPLIELDRGARDQAELASQLLYMIRELARACPS